MSTLQFEGYSLRMISYPDGNHGRGMDLLKYCLKPVSFVCDTKGFESNTDFEGTYHIEITRDTNGEFKIYVNSELKIEYLDNDYSSSEKFAFTSFQGSSAIDNIEVHNDLLDVSNTSNSVTEDSTEDDSIIIFSFGLIALLTPISMRKLRSKAK